MALSDEYLREVVAAGESERGPESVAMARELLAIRERGTLYSEDEVRKAVAEASDKISNDIPGGEEALVEYALRLLRGEGGVKPVCPNCKLPLAPSARAPERWVCTNEHCSRGHISAGEIGVDP